MQELALLVAIDGLHLGLIEHTPGLANVLPDRLSRRLQGADWRLPAELQAAHVQLVGCKGAASATQSRGAHPFQQPPFLWLKPFSVPPWGLLKERLALRKKGLPAPLRFILSYPGVFCIWRVSLFLGLRGPSTSWVRGAGASAEYIRHGGLECMHEGV